MGEILLSNLQDYELAALALDAYQRGYHAGMPDLASRLNDGLGSKPQTAVAGGVIIASSLDLGQGIDEAANFLRDCVAAILWRPFYGSARIRFTWNWVHCAG